MQSVDSLILARKTNEKNNLIESYNGHLIVDDILTNRIVLGKFLNKLGVNYEYAENGYDALKKLTVKNYDLVWMDIKMPIIDGLQCVKIMVYEIQYPGKICIVSGYGDDITRNEFKKLSIDTFLEKPITFNDIKSVINSINKN